MRLDLQHVAAVEGSGQLDGRRLDAEPAEGLAHRIRLGAAALGTRAREHREIAEDHYGVLDEHRVGQGVIAGHTDGLEPPGVECVAVRAPLSLGQVDVDRDALDVGQLPVGEAAGGGPDEGLHAEPLSGRSAARP